MYTEQPVANHWHIGKVRRSSTVNPHWLGELIARGSPKVGEAVSGAGATRVERREAVEIERRVETPLTRRQREAACLAD